MRRRLTGVDEPGSAAGDRARCGSARTSTPRDRHQPGDAAAPGTEYIYRWNRCGRKGQRCKVTARGALNSCRVVFEDGFVMITSRNALRKAKP